MDPFLFQAILGVLLEGGLIAAFLDFEELLALRILNRGMRASYEAGSQISWKAWARASPPKQVIKILEQAVWHDQTPVLYCIVEDIRAQRGKLEETAAAFYNDEFLNSFKDVEMDILNLGACHNRHLVVEIMLKDLSSELLCERCHRILILAINNSNMEIVRMLLHVGGKNFSMQAVHSGVNALHLAAFQGNLEVVKMLLETGGLDLAMLVKDGGVSSLVTAAQEGHLEVVNELLEVGGCDLAMLVTDDGKSCLLVAAAEGHIEVVKRLLEVGGRALAMLVTDDGCNCIYASAFRGHVEVVKVLLHVGGRDLAMLVADNGTGCLYVSALKGHVEVAKALLEVGGYDLAMLVTERGISALYVSAEEGHVDIVKLLLEVGGRDLLMLVTHAGVSCLYVSAREGHRKVTELLLEAGGRELAMLVTNNGSSSLHAAAEHLNLKILTDLLHIGGKDLALICDKDGYSCLINALLKRNIKGALKLIEVGGRDLAMMLTKKGSSSLHAAAERGCAQVAKILVELGGAPLLHLLNCRGHNCLHIAVKEGSKEVTEFLLSGPFGHDLLMSGTISCLDLALEKHDSGMLNTLLLAGGKPLVMKNDGASLFTAICDFKIPVPVMKSAAESFLLVGGKDLALTKNSNGLYPLHAAAVYGNPAAVKQLLLVAPQHTALLAHYGTALHITAQKGHLRVTNMLLGAGGKDLAMIQRPRDGATCLHLAVSRCHLQTVHELLKVGGRELAIKKMRSNETALHKAASYVPLHDVRALFSSTNARATLPNCQTPDSHLCPQLKIMTELLQVCGPELARTQLMEKPTFFEVLMAKRPTWREGFRHIEQVCADMGLSREEIDVLKGV